jgi:hypothetical protein
MNELNSETQLVFPFLDEQPPEPDILAGEIGGQIGYVEAEQFEFINQYGEINLDLNSCGFLKRKQKP